jgi:tetratricopeptide (TPR) repeat protein
MRPPQLGTEQVNCGPDWPDTSDAAGRVISVQTATGDYDLAAIAAKLPSDQQPDVVVCLVDASWRNTPRNLAAFKCPRVLLIADTHHLKSPLIGMLTYASSEPFDRVAVLYDRHHAAFFHAAGFRDLAWLPGLTFPYSDDAVRAARASGTRENRIAFVGQAGKHHPRRTRLLAALTNAQLPVLAKPLAQSDALPFYGGSTVGFNASLNGDLNLRTFEVLASGAALLTDRLAEGSGLRELAAAGAEFATYGDERELTEVARELVRDRKKAFEIGAAGARWFDAHWSESKRREAFCRFVHEGVVPELFAFHAAEKTRVFFGGDTDRLLQATMVYEGVQEIHRGKESPHVQLDPSSAADEIAELFASLPRVKISRERTSTPDVAVFDRNAFVAGDLADASHLWCWNARPEDFEPLANHFTRFGFGLVSEDVAVFGRLRVEAEHRANTPLSMVQAARALQQRGEFEQAFAQAKAALDADPRSVEARVLLAELLLRRPDGAAVAEKLLRQALELKPSQPDIDVLLAEALRGQSKPGAAADVLERVLAREPKHLAALLALAQVRAGERRVPEAEAALQNAWRHHPGAQPVAQALGDLLKQQGRLAEALVWHQRGAGAGQAAIRPVRREKRHVVFVVQHAPQWTSLATVVAAFRADATWRTTVVALPYHHPYLPKPEDRTAIFSFLEQERVPYVRWDEFSLREGCADVIFLQNPYDVTRPAGWKTEDVLRVAPRIGYVPYGIEIGGTAENARNQFAMPLHRSAWAIFARSEEHRRQFARLCPVGASHVTVTGHPKFDLLSGLDAHADPELAAFAAGRPLVLWNPQFDIRPDGGGYSTFLDWWKVMPEEFARHPNIAFVIRPHPLFFSTLISRRILSEAQIAEFKRQCSDAGNVIFDQRPSYLPVFASAAAMISDGSSFLIEFGATGKPICYLHNPRGPLAKLHYEVDFGFVREHCAWATRREQISAFLSNVGQRIDPRRAERVEAIRRQLALGGSGAGAAIKAAVESRLTEEALEASAA